MHSNESVHLQDTPRAISNGLPVFFFCGVPSRHGSPVRYDIIKDNLWAHTFAPDPAEICAAVEEI